MRQKSTDAGNVPETSGRIARNQHGACIGAFSDYGAEIILDVVVFLSSRTYHNPTLDRYEFIRLLGPDEYHENLDNNLVANYQARHVIWTTLELMETVAADVLDRLDELRSSLGITEEFVFAWREMAEKIYVKKPDDETGLIEAFDGFFALEDITPGELEARLQDPGEYWGWPNGIAVETQASKQADTTQLFALHPGGWMKHTSSTCCRARSTSSIPARRYQGGHSSVAFTPPRAAPPGGSWYRGSPVSA